MPGPRYNDAGVSQSARSFVLVKNERNHSTKSPPLLCCTGVRTLSQIKYLFSLEIRKFLLKYTFERDPPPPPISPSFLSHCFAATKHRFSPSRYVAIRPFRSTPLTVSPRSVYPLRKSPTTNFRQVESVPNRLHT